MNLKSRRLFFIGFLLITESCSVPFDANTYSYQPDQESNYYGQLVVNPYTDFVSSIQNECTRIGMVLEPGSPKIKNINGSSERSIGYHCIKKSDEDLPEVEASKIKVDNPTIQNQHVPISINGAKERCMDLGFKAGTEKFGKCVLELTK
jgi:hypothetical protein